MKRKILQVITRLGLGGAERVCFTLMRGLCDEFDFELFAVDNLERDGAIADKFVHDAGEMNIPIHRGTRLRPKLGGMLAGGIALSRVVKNSKPNLIHLHTEVPEAAYAVAAFLHPPIRKIPVVRTIHNTNVWHDHPAVGWWCEQQMLHAHIACVSMGALRSFQIGRTLQNKPKVIYNAVLMPPPQSNGHDPNIARMLFAARFEDQKGAQLLPEIVQSVRPPTGQIYDLKIYGRGTHAELLRSLANDPPLGWQISVEPPLPGLQEILPTFDLVLMPSLFEGLGLTAIESVLAGVPIVATSAPGLIEVFQPSYPWLANPGDAMHFALTLERALTERERWSQVIAESRTFAAERFSNGKMNQNYRILYERAMTG